MNEQKNRTAFVLIVMLAAFGILSNNAVVAQEATTTSVWQPSVEMEVKLTVKGAPFQADQAVFVITGPDKKEYRAKRSFAGSESVSVYFPEDFGAMPNMGDYTWKCLVNGEEVTQGSFRYMSAGLHAEGPLSVEGFERNRSRYEREAAEAGNKIGSGEYDLLIWARARAALIKTDEIRDSAINIDVENGVVTLRGYVSKEKEKAAADRAIREINGVKGIRNELQVTSK